MQSCRVAAGCTSELPPQVQPWHACPFKSSAAAKQKITTSGIFSAFICQRMSRLPSSPKLSFIGTRCRQNNRDIRSVPLHRVHNYSITSSAQTMNDCGTVRESAFDSPVATALKRGGNVGNAARQLHLPRISSAAVWRIGGMPKFNVSAVFRLAVRRSHFARAKLTLSACPGCPWRAVGA